MPHLTRRSTLPPSRTSPLRNVAMSNTLTPGAAAAPAAGAVIGSGGNLGLDPTTDKEDLQAEGKPAEP